MEVAIIGWGSLIWCPGCLRIKSRWHSDGPMLPIEFARISRDRRLTLVIHPGPQLKPTEEVQTYWALSEFGDLKAARENLKARENTRLKHIRSMTAGDPEEEEKGLDDARVRSQIRKWLKANQGIQAAVWTGLPTNWPDKQYREFTPEDALRYLDELERAKDDASAAYNRAREYVINTPAQIDTAVRKIVRERKGWKDADLSRALFEVGSESENS